MPEGVFHADADQFVDQAAGAIQGGFPATGQRLFARGAALHYQVLHETLGQSHC